MFQSCKNNKKKIGFWSIIFILSQALTGELINL